MMALNPPTTDGTTGDDSDRFLILTSSPPDPRFHGIDFFWLTCICH